MNKPIRDQRGLLALCSGGYLVMLVSFGAEPQASVALHHLQVQQFVTWSLLSVLSPVHLS